MGRRLRTVAAVLCAAAAAVWSAIPPAVAGAPGVQPADATDAAVRLAPPPVTISLGFVGDVHMHRAVNRSAQRPDGSFDYAPMFARLAPLVGWFDSAWCHLEQPFAPPGSSVFVEPPQLSSADTLAQGLAAAGFDRCGTASNHSLDRGAAGVDHTLDMMDAAGLGHAGTARTAAEAAPSLFDVGGVTVAHLAYTFGSLYAPPPGQSWRVNITSASRVVSDAAAARQAGAEVVIVDLEWGVDKVVQPTADQRALAHAITVGGGIDLIVGHQAHVLQPISQVNGTWVVWGLGNIISDHPTSSQWPAASQDGALVMVEFTLDTAGVHVGRPVVHPTWCDRANGHVVFPTSAATDPTLPGWLRAALAASTERTRTVVGDYFAPGL